MNRVKETEAYSKLTGEYEQEVKEAFDLFDYNGIGLSMLQNINVKLEHQDFKQIQKKLKKIFKEIDSEGKGLIKFQDFEKQMALKMVTQLQPNKHSLTFKDQQQLNFKSQLMNQRR